VEFSVEFSAYESKQRKIREKGKGPGDSFKGGEAAKNPRQKSRTSGFGTTTQSSLKQSKQGLNGAWAKKGSAEMMMRERELSVARQRERI
jgi:hypothetical protein